jgi:hypothetical protein
MMRFKPLLFLLPALLLLTFFYFRTESFLIEQKEVREMIVKKRQLLKIQSFYQNQQEILKSKTPIQQLEKYLLLQTEIRRLQAMLIQNPHIQGLKQRLDFLRSTANSLRFIEVARAHTKDLLELEMKLTHPVEMDEEDLKAILDLLKPCTIKELSLSKKMAASGEEVYLCDLTIILREIL